MGINKIQISKNTLQISIILIKNYLGVKNYYISIGSGLMISLILSIYLNSLILQTLFFLNGLLLFLVIIYDN